MKCVAKNGNDELYKETVRTVLVGTRPVKKHTFVWDGVVGRSYDEAVELINRKHKTRLFLCKFYSSECIKNDIDGVTGTVFINVDKCGKVISAPTYTLRIE